MLNLLSECTFVEQVKLTIKMEIRLSNTFKEGFCEIFPFRDFFNQDVEIIRRVYSTLRMFKLVPALRVAILLAYVAGNRSPMSSWTHVDLALPVFTYCWRMNKMIFDQYFNRKWINLAIEINQICIYLFHSLPCLDRYHVCASYLCVWVSVRSAFNWSALNIKYCLQVNETTPNR